MPASMVIASAMKSMSSAVLMARSRIRLMVTSAVTSRLAVAVTMPPMPPSTRFMSSGPISVKLTASRPTSTGKMMLASLASV